MLHTYNEILLVHLQQWMDIEIIILSKVSQTEEEKYCVISLICEI